MYCFFQQTDPMTRVLLVPLIVYFSIFSGCSSDESPHSQSPVMEAPDELIINGTKWQRESSINNSDGNLLSHYFKSNPSLVGSPELHGTPEVYHGTRNQRRFYWIKQRMEKTVWTCVEYKKGSFQLSEGQGSPYVNLDQ